MKAKMPNKQMKRCSMSLTIQQMQTFKKSDDIFIPIRLGKKQTNLDLMKLRVCENV